MSLSGLKRGVIDKSIKLAISTPPNTGFFSNMSRAELAHIMRVASRPKPQPSIEISTRGKKSHFKREELYLPSIYGAYGKGGVGTKIQISNSELRNNQSLRGQLNELESSGLITLKVHNVGGVGNTIVCPTEEGVMSASYANQIPIEALRPVLDLIRTNSTVMGLTFLPNSTPSGKLNGVAIDFNIQEKKWWTELERLKISHGRGLSVFSLPISFNELCDRLTDFLNITHGVGQLIDGLKYVQFLIDNSGGVFMAIAAGLTRKEKESLPGYLSKSKSISEVTELIKRANETTSKRRIDIAKGLTQMFGLGNIGDLLADTTYIGLNPARALGTSGAVVDTYNGIAPYAVGVGEIVLRTSKEEEGIIPIGTGARYLCDTSQIELPTGISRDVLEKQGAISAKLEVIDRLTSGFDVVKILKVVGIGYNSSWKTYKRKRTSHFD